MNIGAITANDKLALTLFLAMGLHSLVILGVSFDFDQVLSQAPERTLEITVVRHPRQAEKPEKADFLAQTSQQGGGTLEAPRVPKTRITPPATNPQEHPSREQMGAGASEPQTAKEKVVSAQRAPKPVPRQKQEKPKVPKVTSARDIFEQLSQEIERQTAELDMKMDAYAKRPRTKFISASTQEYKYAAYLQAWKQKVERIGTLNFPDEAKRQKLYGNLMLTVSLRPDGTILNIVLNRSSGQKVLDDAAVRILRLAAPYAPFPANIADEVDVLHITRTWRFTSANQLFTGN
ncbi:MAG: energy transducer TonB [Gammaproteobacteria bacterium]|nr:energy transducer TonB [Gammaproteobacteria bacterium]MBU1654864.1 energy transducer TonB [Gammaproteobacteria bacterium]MBU1961155.1 energy transducer TonB [Gammaproteobacteria bacterium]